MQQCSLKKRLRQMLDVSADVVRNVGQDYHNRI